MSRATANKVYRTFVKGLITEASPLTYPENASTEEDNCVIYRKGNRTRRLGIDYDEDAVLSTFQVAHADIANMVINTYSWLNINDNENTNLLVAQIGATLYFYDWDSEPLEANAFTIDLNDYALDGVTDLETYPVDMVGGKGHLFVVGEKINPFYLDYDESDDLFFEHPITILMRDFEGVDDELGVDEEPTTLTDEHKYNLQNQGWIDPTNDGSGVSVTGYNTVSGRIIEAMFHPTTTVIEAYHTHFSRYPSNVQQWWIGKLASSDPDASPPTEAGDFSPELLAKFAFGSTRAPRGHYIFEAFNRDRSAVSGIAGLPVESFKTRPRAVGFFAGRVWYGHNNTLYYSQLLTENVHKAGFCYQEADPTSENLSDLVATDGGVIPIPEMQGVNHLHPFGSGILAFAENGVWYISGTANSGFTSLDFQVLKVESTGTESPWSIVEAESNIFWWSQTGIQGMTQKSGNFGTIDGAFDRTNITQESIQTFYNELSVASRKYVKGVYDPANNVIQWVFKTNNVNINCFYNRILNLDLSLSAFYPWTIMSFGTDRPWVTDIFMKGRDTIENRQTFIKYFVVEPVSTNWKFTFAYFKDDTFMDWRSFNNTGFAFNSYVETGFELMDDTMRKKMLPYLFCYFRRTEENYIEDGDDYTVDKPSSCLLRIKWDWADSAFSNKWSPEVEVYRHRRMPLMSEDDLEFNNGYSVVVSKNKIRGSGKSFQFRFFCNEEGKDFDLLGWAVSISGNTIP
jgi:hypothetical protein